MNKPVKVRFCPSPTGFLHAGGIRTALYNYLFAKKHGGEFILRIEDTDQARTVPGAVDYIEDSLKWLGIPPDKGYGASAVQPYYIQSFRAKFFKIYDVKVKLLIENGSAYYAFDTAEEIEAMKKRCKDAGITMPSYSFYTRMGMKNSLTLSNDDVQERIKRGDEYVVRFKIPEISEKIKFTDLIRGDVEFDTNQMDDKVLIKSDGMPTYHLANVVDDIDMEISHVIRGEEWLPSTPLHLMLYSAFGKKDSIPEFAHLPLILKPNGKGKLSKRDGIKLGITMFPFTCVDAETGQESIGYQEAGYLPAAVLNMLALVGWNPGGGSEQEIFSLDELVAAFDLNHVHKAGARYNPDKAKWFNQNYVRNTDSLLLAEMLIKSVPDKLLFKFDIKFIAQVIDFLKDRIVFAKDILEKGKFFFSRPTNYSSDFVKKKWDTNLNSVMSGLFAGIFTMIEWTPETIKNQIDFLSGGHRVETNLVKQTLNVMMTGTESCPDIYQTIYILGKIETTNRITNAIQAFNSMYSSVQ